MMGPTAERRGWRGLLLKLPVNPEIMARVMELEIPFNAKGVDAYGVSRRHLAETLTVFALPYRRYFKVLVHGIEHVPPRGRAMVVGNHSGGFALDAGCVFMSTFFEMNPPRLAQGMVEKFIAQFPIAAMMATRSGQLTGLPENAARLLEDERLLMVFPEGARGTAKLYKDRYSLVNFGSGFIRLALRTRTPIVPMAFLGGGEAVPTIANAVTLGRLFGVPYIPITPWLLPLPLPVQLDVYYGEPLIFEGTGSEEDSVIASYVERVKERIAEMIERGRLVRKGDQ
jgi:1-acyl-sn-glycerol-3-phosphate acyltransferase